MITRDCLIQIAMSIRDENGMTEDVVWRNAKTLQLLLSIVVWRVRQFWQLLLYGVCVEGTLVLSQVLPWLQLHQFRQLLQWRVCGGILVLSHVLPWLQLHQFRQLLQCSLCGVWRVLLSWAMSSPGSNSTGLGSCYSLVCVEVFFILSHILPWLQLHWFRQLLQFSLCGGVLYPEPYPPLAPTPLI